MIERWAGVDEIARATARLEDGIPGWRRPVAYGIGWDVDGSFAFTRTSAAADPLPAVVLATVCGHVAGSGSYRLDAEALDRAIALLAPADACAYHDNPQLGTWRSMRGQLDDGQTVTAVFAGAYESDADDPMVAALLADVLAGRTENADGTTTLWRPVGPAELELLAASDWRRWPPRLPDQPVFYPVLSREYAERIAAEWNVPDSGRGYVTRFDVDTGYVRRFPTQRAGGRDILELWVPAEDLDEFNDHIVGRIEVVGEYGPAS